MPGALAPPSAYTTCAVEASPTGDGVGALEPFHGSAGSAVETPVPNPPAEPTIPTATAPASSRFIVASSVTRVARRAAAAPAPMVRGCQQAIASKTRNPHRKQHGAHHCQHDRDVAATMRPDPVV